MNRTHTVISALLDNEPFDARELAEALSDPAGRALLIDLASLRQIVQPADAVPPRAAMSPARRRGWVPLAAAAALLLALGGGYAAGTRRADATPEPPQATRMVQAEPFTPSGGTP